MADAEVSMSQGDFIKIGNLLEIEKRLPHLIKRVNEWDYARPLCITLKPYTNPRSLNQNALFHVWCKTMSEKFIEKVPTATPENIKLMMKQRFLGTEDIKIGKTVIENQVKHTSDLDVGEMVHFMDNVYHWARDNGILLEVPQNSEYQKLKNQQES
jgi:hypothetical protein